MLKPCGLSDSARRVWSLLEIMTQFSLGAVIGDMQLLLMSVYLYMTDKDEAAKLSDGDLDRLASMLGRTSVVLKCAGLEKSSKDLDATIEWIGGFSKILTKQAIGVKLMTVCDGFQKEANSKKFISLESDLSGYLDGHPFGIDVVLAFPSAAEDIRQASNCLAFECNTACVFHLMRAVEWGMRSLCTDLGIRKTRRTKKSGKVLYSPIEYSEWEKILDQLRVTVDTKLSRLKRGKEKQALQEFYHPALQELRAFRDAWRNHVMHTRAEYSREDALAVFGHVKRFMIKLASRINEV